jgi:hypothetical protein
MRMTAKKEYTIPLAPLKAPSFGRREDRAHERGRPETPERRR